MPTASEEDERKWLKAKEIAEYSGRKDVYPYIMGVYKRMKPDYFRIKRNGSDAYSSAKQHSIAAMLKYRKTRSSVDLLHLRDRLVILQTVIAILGGDKKWSEELSAFVEKESNRLVA